MVRTLWMALAGAAVLGGCATLLADKECTEGRWQEVGFRDGAEGRQALSFWQAKCGGFDLPVDAPAYERGYRDGVATGYCHPDKAYQEGRQGRGYDSQLCAGRQELRARHEAGLRDYCQPRVAQEAGAQAGKYEFDRCGRAAPELRRAWQEGVASGYCRPAAAYRAGHEDKSFQLSLCPPNVESAFRTGLEVRSLNKSLGEVDSELYRQKRRRDDGKASAADRRDAEHRVQDLERERRRLREKLDTLERLGRNY